MTIFPHNFIGSRIQVNCFVTRVTRWVPLVEHLSGVRVTRSLVLCVIFCRSFFVLLAIVLFVLRFTDSDYPFGIFKLCLTYSLTMAQKEIRFGKLTHSNIPIVNLPSHIESLRIYLPRSNYERFL